MPFKDIDYKKLNQSRELTKRLQTTVSTINKTTDASLSPSERIAAVELLTGKTLQPRLNPMKSLLSERQTALNSAPVVKMINNLNERIKPAAPLMIEPPPGIEDPPGIDLYDRFGFTDGDMQYYRNNKFADLNEIAIADDQGFVQELIPKLTALNRKLGYQQSAITRTKHKTDFHYNRALEIEREQQHVKKYRDALRKLSTQQFGEGVHIGKYIVPIKRLKRDNIASVRYANNNKKMVPTFNATRVSNNVKKVLLGKSTKLTSREKEFLDKLYMNAGHTISQRQAKTIRGSSVFTNVREISERVQVLFGELQAGNTSVDLKNELVELLHYMFKHGKIKKADYKNLVSIIQYGHPADFHK